MPYSFSLYMHDLDRKAFDALNMFPQFVKLQEAYVTNVDEKVAKDIVANEGEDYRAYTTDSKKVIASCASVAVSVKSVLDTPLLTDDGLLTEDAEKTATNIEGFLENMRIKI